MQTVEEITPASPANLDLGHDLASAIVAPQDSDLAMILSNVTWKDDFDLGVGVDAVTGMTAVPAVEVFNVEKHDIQKGRQSVNWVRSESKLREEIGAAISGSYNAVAVSVDNRNRYLEELRFSSVSTTLLAVYQFENTDYDQAPRSAYRLTDEARSLLAHPEKFRSQYGDYFIAGGKRGAKCIVLYQCQARSIAKLKSFQSAVGGGNEIFSSKGSTKFSKAAEKYGISITIRVDYVGIRGQQPALPKTPGEVPGIIEKFKKQAAGTYVRAKMVHYASLAPELPRTVAVSPDVFSDLHQLYGKVWEARSLFGSAPDHYQRDYKTRLQQLNDDVQSNQSRLPNDRKLRQRCHHQVDSLLSDLRLVRDRQELYFLALDARSTEPRKGHEIEPRSTGTLKWLYGRTGFSRHGSRVTVHHDKLDWKGMDDHSYRFGPDQERLIVGWQVHSLRSDGLNGRWWKDVDHILVTNHGVVSITNDTWRVADYEVTYYWVDARDYRFGDD